MRRALRRTVCKRPRNLGTNTFCRLRDYAVHHLSKVAGAIVLRELAIRARSIAHDLEGVLHLPPAAQLVHHVVHEPLEHLRDQLARRLLDLTAEIYQLAVEPEADRAPFVLVDHGLRIETEGEVVATQLPDLAHDRLKDCGEAYGFVHTSANVADAEFQRGIGMMRPDVPPDLRAVRDAARLHERVHQLVELRV